MEPRGQTALAQGPVELVGHRGNALTPVPCKAATVADRQLDRHLAAGRIIHRVGFAHDLFYQQVPIFKVGRGLYPYLVAVVVIAIGFVDTEPIYNSNIVRRTRPDPV